MGEDIMQALMAGCLAGIYINTLIIMVEVCD